MANSDVIAYGDCSCDFCQGWRAANPLQNGGSNCPGLASTDADLQRVVGAWEGLRTVAGSEVGYRLGFPRPSWLPDSISHAKSLSKPRAARQSTRGPHLSKTVELLAGEFFRKLRLPVLGGGVEDVQNIVFIRVNSVNGYMAVPARSSADPDITQFRAGFDDPSSGVVFA